MTDRYFTAVYRLPLGVFAGDIIAHPHWVAGSWSHAIEELAVSRTLNPDAKHTEALRRRDQLQEIADSQLGTIKALVMGCEKYGLTETTPVVRHIDALENEVNTLTVKCASLERDAQLGKVAMRFVDRAGDVHPGIDDAETICAEFYAAMVAQVMAPTLANPAQVTPTLFELVDRLANPRPEDYALRLGDYRLLAYEAITTGANAIQAEPQKPELP